jgi:MarR family transcriptional repressor of emrRAB
MRGSRRLALIAASSLRMERALPDLPMPGTVIVRLLRIAGFGLQDYFEPVFRSLGLTEKTFHVLCLLTTEDDGFASPARLSEMIGSTRANMTRLIEALVSDGYVVRSIDPRDARRHIIRITPAGRAKTTSAAPQLAEPIHSLLSSFNDKERTALTGLLRKLILSLDKTPRSLRVAA